MVRLRNRRLLGEFVAPACGRRRLRNRRLLGELIEPACGRRPVLLPIDRRSRIDRRVGGSGGASAPHTPRHAVVDVGGFTS